METAEYSRSVTLDIGKYADVIDAIEIDTSEIKVINNKATATGNLIETDEATGNLIETDGATTGTIIETSTATGNLETDGATTGNIETDRTTTGTIIET